ncbi:MAG: tetratricopeptide repeat protein [Saprospiraceae bacterium]|uniref:Tetratricopeptide repeat protein n=1 Tax=Candidatus Opimibacter skivensis TaxID=2982028 RepID=A0A9D7SST0_9BACT|nr:tetratricopeptide repeat protein [Candidatus Opimibacter skivensis]
MKQILFVLIYCLPNILSAQNRDSMTVVKQVDSLLTIANDLRKSGKNTEALPVAQEAADISKQKWGENNVTYASSLHRLASIYSGLKEIDHAEELYLKALELREKLLGKWNADYAASLNNLATLYGKKGDYSKAELLFKQLIEIDAKILGKEHPDYVSSLNSLGYLYWVKGDYGKAESLYLEAKEIRGETLGKEHPDYIASLDNLASAYFYNGDYLKAEPVYLEALEIKAKTLGKEHPAYITDLNTLAVLYIYKGEYGKAEPLLLLTIEKKAKVLGKEHSSYATSLDNLANLYLTIGDYKKAEPLFMESKEIRAKALGKEHLGYASSLNNLAVLYMDTKDYDKAEPLILEALEIKAKTIGKEHPDYAVSLNNLAGLYKDKGDYAKAEPLNLEAIAIREKTVGKEHPDYAVSLNNLASLYFEEGEYVKAESLNLQAKEIQLKVLGKEHPDYVTTLNNLALLYWKTKRDSLAASSMAEIFGIQRASLLEGTQYLSDWELSEYEKTFVDAQNQYYSFTQTLGKDGGEMKALCFDIRLFYNGFLLATANQMKRLALSDSSTAKKYMVLSDFHRILSREYAKPIADRDSSDITDLKEKANNLEKEVIRTIAGYGEASMQVSWKDVQAKLKRGEAAIEFTNYRYYTPNVTDSTMYAALVLLPGDTMPHFIPLFEEQQLLTLLNKSVLPDEMIVKDLYANRPELYRILWQPIEFLLHDVKTVYYSPSGLLNNLNPAALLDESGVSISKGRQWVRLSSTRDLVTGHLADSSFIEPTNNLASHNLNSAIIYGGINYDMDSLAFASANSVKIEDSLQTIDIKDGNFRYVINEQYKGSRGEVSETWPSLPHSGLEADQVSAVLRGAGFLTEEQKGFFASEENFKKIGVNGSSPRILHIATHGFSYPESAKKPQKKLGDNESNYTLLEDPMLRSGLVLAGGNYYWKNKRPLANFEDGVLVAYEVRDLNLRNTELAILSACQTGLGDIVGSEGVYGLQRAFRIAGVKFLIVSLWHIPDEKTQELMQLFYQNWAVKKESLRDAFSNAQQAMQEMYGNPYLWAGFVLVE